MTLTPQFNPEASSGKRVLDAMSPADYPMRRRIACHSDAARRIPDSFNYDREFKSRQIL